MAKLYGCALDFRYYPRDVRLRFPLSGSTLRRKFRYGPIGPINGPKPHATGYYLNRDSGLIGKVTTLHPRTGPRPLQESAMRPSGVGFRTRVLPPNTEAPAEDLVSQVVVQFKSAAGEAVAAPVAIVRDPEAPASARVLWCARGFGVHSVRRGGRGPSGTH